MLADVLDILARTGEIRAGIVHVDHAVREDSAEAASVVEALAADLGMPFYLRRLEPGIAERHPASGPEEAMRRERYLAFADVAAIVGADAVAVAHHQRDQAETVLLHLVRGSGLAGASGMREWTGLEVPWWTSADAGRPLTVWRPLLTESFESLVEWHVAERLPLSDDPSNDDGMFRRNVIRHEILPELESIAPGAVRNLARFAGIAAEDEAALDAAARETAGAPARDVLPRSVLVDASIAIQRRIVRNWLLQRGAGTELSLERVDAVRELARRNRTGAVVEIGEGWQVRLERAGLTAISDERVP